MGGVHRALEVGCGEGYSTEYLRKLLPTSVVLEASEFLEWQVKIAQQRLPDIPIVQEDLYHMHRADASCDLLFALEVFEHLPDIPAALKELRRVTRRYLIVGVPREPLWRILNIARGKYIRAWGNTPGHINHWSAKEITNTIHQNGFRPIIIAQPTPWTLVLVEKT